MYYYWDHNKPLKHKVLKSKELDHCPNGYYSTSLILTCNIKVQRCKIKFEIILYTSTISLKVWLATFQVGSFVTKIFVTHLSKILSQNSASNPARLVWTSFQKIIGKNYWWHCWVVKIVKIIRFSFNLVYFQIIEHTHNYPWK